MIRRLFLATSTATTLACLLACGGAGSTGTTPTQQQARPGQQPGQEVITRQQLGDDWPFTVEEGILAFKQTGGAGVGAVTFTANGKTYGLNGIARGKSFGFADINEVWADEPGAAGVKKNLGPVIDRGLKLGR